MFSVNVNEIKNNRPLAPADIEVIAFLVRQTFERYTYMIVNGYLDAESRFRDPDGYILDLKRFDPNNEADREYADCRLKHNLEIIRYFCFDAADARAFLEEKGVTNGYTSGGLNDFLFETIGPCLALENLLKSGVMEWGYDVNQIYWLLIHFFARLKLVYGSLEQGVAPDMDMVWELVELLGIHEHHFSFREITLLAGFKTERAVRNLASPSTPAHRRLAVIKDGRNTYVTHAVLREWLDIHYSR